MRVSKKNMHVSTHATFINTFIKIDPTPPSSSPKTTWRSLSLPSLPSLPPSFVVVGCRI
jgi:hypothetical protein